MVNLEVNISGIKLRNPTLLASGIIGTSATLLIRAYKEGAGGVVTKSFTKERREGYPTPIIVAHKCGFINAVGLANPGIDGIKEIIPKVKAKGVPIIVSIAGTNPEDFLILALEAEKYGADGIELNLSCPHTKRFGLEIGTDKSIVREIITKLKDHVRIPIFAKFGLTDNIIEIAKVAEESGIDGIVAINTIKGMVIDVWLKRPILSNKYGGVSGPAIHPIATRIVYDLYESVNVPIIGVGGVDDWKSAVELILAGARAVQIGSALAYKGFRVFREIVNGICRYMERSGFNRIEEIVGLAHKG